MRLGGRGFKTARRNDLRRRALHRRLTVHAPRIGSGRQQEDGYPRFVSLPFGLDLRWIRAGVAAGMRAINRLSCASRGIRPYVPPGRGKRLTANGGHAARRLVRKPWSVVPCGVTGKAPPGVGGTKPTGGEPTARRLGQCSVENPIPGAGVGRARLLPSPSPAARQEPRPPDPGPKTTFSTEQVRTQRCQEPFPV